MKRKGLFIFILVVLAFLYLYYSMYTTTKTTIEPFEQVVHRPCTVWFTEKRKECDQGLFHKDAKTLEYMSKADILENLDTQIINTKEKIEDINNILKKYDGLTLTEIEKIVLADLEENLKQEERKYLPDTVLIQKYKFEIETYRIIAKKYFTEMDELKQEKILLENELVSLNQQKEAYKYKPTYTILEDIKNIKEKDPDFKCKVEFNGLDELYFENNPDQSDLEKNAYGYNMLGDPKNWAYCHKDVKTIEDKQNSDKGLQSLYQLAKKFKLENLSGLRPYDAKLSPTISSVMFNEFKQDDVLACATSRYPTIPNGMLEIKLTNRDTIEQLRVVKYVDPRYISDTLSMQLSEVDPLFLMELLFDLIIEINKKKVMVYIYPNKMITYKVYYLYFDKKCNQFYGDTTIPYGPSKTGDLLQFAKPETLIEKELGESYTESTVREYLNPTNISIAFFNDKIAEWNKELEPLLTNLNTVDENLEKYIYLQYIYKVLSSNQPETVKKLKIDEASEKPSYKVLVEKNLTKEAYLEKAKEYQDLISKDTAEQTKIKKNITEIQSKITEVRNFINMLKPFVIQSIKKTIPSYIKNYIGKPIKEFIHSYTPIYISNYNTIYMAITSINKNTKNTITLHTPTPAVITNATYKEVTRTPYYPVPEDINFEDNLFISNFKPENYF